MRSTACRATRRFLSTALIGAAVSSAAHSGNDAGGPTVPFPEYDLRTACLESALVPDASCVRLEAATRALLLSGWRSIEVQYETSVSSCIALLAHPDAAPRSYKKLLACLAGDLYAEE